LSDSRKLLKISQVQQANLLNLSKAVVHSLQFFAILPCKYTYHWFHESA